jgi:kynurenine formamidase
MVDLHRHLGEARTHVNLEMLLKIMEADRLSVSEGDILCLHTGLGQLIVNSPPVGPDPSIRLACAVLDGSDQALLNWITESGVAAIAADNLAVESSSTLGVRKNIGPLGAVLPLHEHCLFKLGVHLGELWYLTELANWLHKHQRSRFLLTAPPLRLPGAAGSAVTPVATV